MLAVVILYCIALTPVFVETLYEAGVIITRWRIYVSLAALVLAALLRSPISIVLLIGVLSLAAADIWSRLRLRRELLSSRCLRCGYDLRASKECCPECGEPISVELRRLRRYQNVAYVAPPIQLDLPDRLLPDQPQAKQ